VGAGVFVLHQLDAEEALKDRGKVAHDIFSGGEAIRQVGFAGGGPEHVVTGGLEQFGDGLQVPVGVPRLGMSHVGLEQRKACLGVGVVVQPADERGDGEGVAQGPQCRAGLEAAEACLVDQVREMRADLVGVQPVPADVDSRLGPA